jgi:hypothetical protein
MNSKKTTGLDADAVPKNAAKKTYSRPELHIYGDIRAMTNSSAAGGTPDGMSGSLMNMSNP